MWDFQNQYNFRNKSLELNVLVAIEYFINDGHIKIVNTRFTTHTKDLKKSNNKAKQKNECNIHSTQKCIYDAQISQVHRLCVCMYTCNAQQVKMLLVVFLHYMTFLYRNKIKIKKCSNFVIYSVVVLWKNNMGER